MNVFICFFRKWYMHILYKRWVNPHPYWYRFDCIRDCCFGHLHKQWTMIFSSGPCLECNHEHFFYIWSWNKNILSATKSYICKQTFENMNMWYRNDRTCISRWKCLKMTFWHFRGHFGRHFEYSWQWTSSTREFI